MRPEDELHYRQGDIGFLPVNRARLEGCAPIERVDGRIIVAEGEREGHVHAIESPEVFAFRHHEGAMLLDVKGGATVTHQQHPSVALPPGVLEVVQQAESNPFNKHTLTCVD